MKFFSEIALPCVLFIIMLGIGVSTKLNDFKALIRFPKAAILGIISQVFILPLIALGIGYGFNYSNEIIMGLLLLSLCPSGTGSNIITKMVQGNLALSVSLTTISNFKSLLTIPLIMNWYIEFSQGSVAMVKLPFVDMIIQIFLLTLLPTAIGVYIAEKYKGVVEATKKTLKWLLPALLFGVFTAIMFFEDSPNKDVNISEMIIPAILINVLSMFISLLFVKMFKVENKQAIAIGVESGLKNSAIGLLVVTQFLQIPALQLLILAYSFISFYLTLVLAVVIKKVMP